MRFSVLWVFLAASLVLPSPALAWGKTGHRVVAAIADKELSGRARAEVQLILGPGESLDEAANGPDEMRSAPGEFWQKTATPWHYVTITGASYDHAPPEGDALEALGRFSRILEDPGSSRADKQLALRFVVHLVGDLHQPLHVGKCCDRGGNDVKVSWFGKLTNLHSVWDSQLVDEEQLSFSELAAKLERHISPNDVIAWWNTNPRDWVGESAVVRDTLYPHLSATAAPGDKSSGQPPAAELSYSYVYQFTPVMEKQLEKGGIRLAAYLNMIFDRTQLSPAKPQR